MTAYPQTLDREDLLRSKEGPCVMVAGESNNQEHHQHHNQQQQQQQQQRLSLHGPACACESTCGPHALACMDALACSPHQPSSPEPRTPSPAHVDSCRRSHTSCSSSGSAAAGGAPCTGTAHSSPFCCAAGTAARRASSSGSGSGMQATRGGGRSGRVSRASYSSSCSTTLNSGTSSCISCLSLPRASSGASSSAHASSRAGSTLEGCYSLALSSNSSCSTDWSGGATFAAAPSDPDHQGLGSGPLPDHDGTEGAEASGDGATLGHNAVPSPDRCGACGSGNSAGAGGSSGSSGRGCFWILSKYGGREVLSDFEFGPHLGRGTFGVTRLVTERATALPFACKTVCKARMVSSPQYVEDMRGEVRILQHLVGVPGVVQLRGAYEDCRAVNLVLEFCAGGDLLDHILRLGRLEERDAAAAARAIVLALQRCHARGVMHRDVKPENFLLAEAGRAASCRVSDFGVSAFFRAGQKFWEVVGTPYYMAPEVLLRRYDQSADIWSAGVILYLMLSGELPFMAPTDRQVCAAVLHAPITLDGANWDAVSDGAKAVVRRMLCREPARRAAPEELLSHPWLAGKEVVAAVEGAQALPAANAGAVTGACAGERQVVRQGMELQQRREE